MEKEISLKYLLETLRSAFKVIFMVTITTFVLSLIYAVQATKLYTAQVVLFPGENLNSDLQQEFKGGFQSLLGSSSNSSETDKAMAVIESREFAGSFIEQEDLKPIFFPSHYAELAETEISDWKAFKVYSSILNVDQNLKTSVITLSITWSDPKLAAQWANRIVKSLNEVMSKRSLIESNNNIDFLSNQSRAQNKELKQAVVFLMQQESRKKMLANKSQDYSFMVLDPAVVPEDKTSPQRLLIVIGFTFLALLFSTLGVLIRDYILRQLKD